MSRRTSGPDKQWVLGCHARSDPYSVGNGHGGHPQEINAVAKCPLRTRGGWGSSSPPIRDQRARSARFATGDRSPTSSRLRKRLTLEAAQPLFSNVSLGMTGGHAQRPFHHHCLRHARREHRHTTGGTSEASTPCGAMRRRSPCSAPTETLGVIDDLGAQRLAVIRQTHELHRQPGSLGCRAELPQRPQRLRRLQRRGEHRQTLSALRWNTARNRSSIVRK